MKKIFVATKSSKKMRFVCLHKNAHMQTCKFGSMMSDKVVLQFSVLKAKYLMVLEDVVLIIMLSYTCVCAYTMYESSIFLAGKN